jgi:hypothetical protein
MKIFLSKILVFIALIISIGIFSLFYLPNPTVKTSMLGALQDKHLLLKETPSPKIIFIGGSNVNFGLDSKKVKEELHINVVDMGLHAGIGLKYSMEDIKPYIKKGDYVVVIPEYEQLYMDIFYGDMELVYVVFDVYKAGKKHIDFHQWLHLANFIPVYGAKKLLLLNTKPVNKIRDPYSRNSFNKFGDSYIHWTLPRENVTPAAPSTEKDKVNEDVVEFLKSYDQYTKSKSAVMLVMPPVYQTTSYVNRTPIIKLIKESMVVSGFPYIADPSRYKFADSLFFNTNYHLTKTGVDLRTDLVIEDLRRYIKLSDNK